MRFPTADLWYDAGFVTGFGASIVLLILFSIARIGGFVTKEGFLNDAARAGEGPPGNLFETIVSALVILVALAFLVFVYKQDRYRSFWKLFP